jgi:hypothetical protein
VKRPRSHAAEAEALFREIAAQAKLSIERVDEPQVELLMRLPKQAGLAFDVTLGLQNADELNLGVDAFWSSIFPFPRVQEDFRRVALEFLAGRSRIAEFSRRGRVFKQVLQAPDGGGWRRVYTQWDGLHWPFGAVAVRYIANHPH